MTALDTQDLRTLFLRSPDPDCLSAPERERMTGFGSDLRRAQFRLGRTALRQIAASTLGCAPSEVPLEIAPNGAPFLPGTGLHLSLSHSADAALAVLAPHPVGCDLEAPPRRQRDVLALARCFFAPEEAQLLEALEPSVRSMPFLAMWTRKEAVYKSGAVDWPAALTTAWQSGDNLAVQGNIRLSTPELLPEGWIANIARHLPRLGP